MKTSSVRNQLMRVFVFQVTCEVYVRFQGVCLFSPPIWVPPVPMKPIWSRQNNKERVMTSETRAHSYADILCLDSSSEHCHSRAFTNQSPTYGFLRPMPMRTQSIHATVQSVDIFYSCSTRPKLKLHPYEVVLLPFSFSNTCYVSQFICNGQLQLDVAITH